MPICAKWTPRAAVTISDVSHELRNPLSALQASLSLVHSGRAGPLNADQSKLLGAAVRNCTRLDLLLSDLVEISRFEAGHMELKVCPVHLGTVMAQVKSAMQDKAAAKRITVTTQVSSELPDPDTLPTKCDSNCGCLRRGFDWAVPFCIAQWR